MTSRNDMDRPATVLTALIGILLIAGTLPFLLMGGGGKTTYDLTWTEVDHDSATANSGAVSVVQSVTIPAVDIQPSNATIELASCTDPNNAQVYGTATISYTLFENGTPVPGGSGSFTCADVGETVRIPFHPHSDVGSVGAGSTDAAEAKAYAGGNRTATYRVDFTYTRSGGSVPGGVAVPGAQNLQATLELTVLKWVATANAPGQEVTR